MQRDVRELARIDSLTALQRLLGLAAAQTARLTNMSELAAPFQLSRQTIGDYITLLERVFLLYDGETTASFGEGLHAVPLRALWETK